MQARYEPVDLAAVTAELASVFRSAVDRAGLEFDVDCPRWTNRSTSTATCGRRWSSTCCRNALKFTFDGSISVAVRRGGRRRGRHRRRHRDRCARRGDASAVRTVPPHRDGSRALQRGQRHRAGAGEGAGRPARRHASPRAAPRVRAPRSRSACPSVPPTCPHDAVASTAGARRGFRARRTVSCRRPCAGCPADSTPTPLRSADSTVTPDKAAIHGRGQRRPGRAC